MEEILNRSSIRNLIILFLLASISFKIIPGWIPFFRREWIPMMMAFIVISPVIFRSLGNYIGLLIPFICYVIVALCNCFSGDTVYSTSSVVIYDALLLVLPITLSILFLQQNNLKHISCLLFICAIFFIIELFTSLILRASNPGLIRNLYSDAQLSTNGIEYQFSFYKMGLLDYGMAHALPILIPPLFYAYKSINSTRKKIYCCLLITVVCILIYISDSTTSLILMCLMLALGIVSNSSGIQQNRNKIFLLALFSTPLLFSDDFVLFLLDSIENLFSADSSYIDKVEEFKHSILYNETTGDLASRGEKYLLTLKGFLSNPILGTNNDLGDHAALLDQLATLGLIGFVPLVVLLFRYFRYIINFLSFQGTTFYYEGVLAFLLMVLLKGMWIWPMFFCVCILLPLIIYIIDYYYINNFVNE